MENFDILANLVGDVELKFKRVLWGADRIREQFGKRTLGEILNDGEIHYQACHERNMVVAYFASLNGIHCDLVTTLIKRFPKR